MKFEIANIMGKQCRVKKLQFVIKRGKDFVETVLAEDVPVNSNPGVNRFVNNDSTLVFGCVMILVRSA